MRCPENVLRSISAQDGSTALECVCRKIRQDLLGVVDMMWRHLNARGMSTQDCNARIGKSGRLRIFMDARDDNVRPLSRLILDASVLAQLEHLDVYISPEHPQITHMSAYRCNAISKSARFELIVPESANDAPTVTAASPFLSRLSIDLGSSRWDPSIYIGGHSRQRKRGRRNSSEQISWSVPISLFAAGSALRTLLVRGIGFPSVTLVERISGNLVSFTYHGPATVYSSQLDNILNLAAGLRALSVRCHEFIDNSTTESPSLAAHIEHIIASQVYTDLNASETGIVRYLWKRGARDMAVSLGTQNFASDRPNAIFPSNVFDIACSDGGLSLRCADLGVDVNMNLGEYEIAAIRRMRVMADDIRDASSMLLDSLKCININLLTRLSLHEYPYVGLFYGVHDPAVLATLPGQLGIPPFLTPQFTAVMHNTGVNFATLGATPAQALPHPPPSPFRFPNVAQVTVWLATCADHRDSLRVFMGMPGSHETFSSIFTLWRREEAGGGHVSSDQRCVPPEMPRLVTFELSSSPLVSERLHEDGCHDFEYIKMARRENRFSIGAEDRKRLRALWCSCLHGACVAVHDVHDFLLRHGYAEQSLAVRLSGLKLVDVDLHSSVLALQSDVGTVEVGDEPAPCDVCRIADFELLDATETFQQLDGMA